MDIEEWHPEPRPLAPPAPPPHKGRVITRYVLAGIGAFGITVGVMGHHEIADYLAQRSVKRETPSVAAAPAPPASGQPVAHIVAAESLRPLPPAAVATNSSPNGQAGPRPLPKEKPVLIASPAERAQPIMQ